MSQTFFGQFLLDDGAIEEDALVQALELASKESARVGALGVEKGYLTPTQVELVQLEQRTVDARFVDLAVELEMLTPAQASELLAEQKRRHKPIGEALVELGHLGAEDLDALLDRFHLGQFALDTAHLELPVDLMHDDLAPYLVAYLPKLFRRVTQVPMKLRAGRPFNGRSNLPHRAMVSITGDCPLAIGIAMCSELSARIHRGMHGDAGGAPGSTASTASLVEFAEVFADAGRRSIESDGLQARTTRAASNQLPKSGFWFPATTPFGRGILVLSVD